MPRQPQPSWADTQRERKTAAIEQALDAIRDGTSVNEAARMVDVNPSTLRGWLKERRTKGHVQFFESVLDISPRSPLGWDEV